MSNGLAIGLGAAGTAIQTAATLIPGIKADFAMGQQLPDLMLNKLCNIESSLLQLSLALTQCAGDMELPVNLRTRSEERAIKVKQHYIVLLAHSNVVWLLNKSSAAEKAKLRDQLAYEHFHGKPAAAPGPKPFHFRWSKWMTSPAERCHLLEKLLIETDLYIDRSQKLELEVANTRNTILMMRHTTSIVSSGAFATALNQEVGACVSQAGLESDVASTHSNEGTICEIVEALELAKIQDDAAQVSHSGGNEAASGVSAMVPVTGVTYPPFKK